MQTLIRERSFSISSISMRQESENKPVTPSSSSISYLKFQNLADMLKVILYAAESPLGSSPMLYHIRSDNKDILFIESGILAPVVHYYIIQDKEPTNKWIELRRLTGEYSFVDKIGNDTKSLYIPVLELEKSSFDFPI
ncbi:MAG: hypothetical protein WBV72_13375 [Nitrososphaeraceae archaeon]